MPAKPRGAPIKPGQVLNPGGRPKIPEELKARAKALCPEILEIWIGIARNKESKDSDRLRAGENIWDRAYGKAIQAVDVETSAPRVVDTKKLTADQIDAITALAIATTAHEEPPPEDDA